MATKTLNTRIITKHADLDVLEQSNLTLKEGEIVLAKVNVSQPDGTVAPTFVAKIGNNATFANSPWLFAKASDVYSWAKKSALDVSDIPTLEISKINGLQAALNAKVDSTTFDAAISRLDAAVASANSSAVTEAKGYADELNTAMNTRVAAIEDDYLKEADKTALQTNINNANAAISGLQGELGKVTDPDTGILATANAYTDTEVAKANTAAATAQGAAEAAQAAADKAQGEVDALESTVSANKSTLEAQIGSLDEAYKAADTQIRTDFAAADADVRADFEAADSALDVKIGANTTAINNEATARANADAALDTRVSAVEGKLADVTNVMDFRGAVTAKPAVDGYQNGDVIVVTEGDDAGKEFVLSNGAWVEFGSTSATDVALSELQNRVTAVENNKAAQTALDAEVSAREAADGVLQGNIDTLSGTVTANKSAFDTYKTNNDARVDAIEAKNTEQDTIIAASKSSIEAIQGDYLKNADKTDILGQVTAEETARKNADDALGNRIDEVISAAETLAGRVTTVEGTASKNAADIGELASTVEGMDTAYKAADKTLSDDLAALTTRVGTAEGNITSINTEVAKKADKTTVDAIETRVINIEAKAIFEDDEIILDCGGAE